MQIQRKIAGTLSAAARSVKTRWKSLWAKEPTRECATAHDGSRLCVGMRVDLATGGFEGAVRVVKVYPDDNWVELEYSNGVKGGADAGTLVPYAIAKRRPSRKRRGTR